MLTLTIDRRQALVQRRIAHARAFLKTRGLDFDWLRKSLEARLESPVHLLLTSSPVQGLANSKSDIDIICVAKDTVDVGRMSSQVYCGDEHIDTISFTESEVNTCLRRAQASCDDTPASALDAVLSWNSRESIAKKYFERIVNGVDVSEAMPYEPYLPALATLWRLHSFHEFARSAICALLAEAAGEIRGRVGYALNSLFLAMDMIMSHTGDVYSNKKWHLLRWSRFVAQSPCDGTMSRLIKVVGELQGTLSRALSDPRCHVSTVDPILELVEVAPTVLGLHLRKRELFSDCDHCSRMPFVREAELHLANDGFCLQTDAPPASELAELSVSDLAQLSAGRAASLLASLRSGVRRLHPL